MITTPSLFGQLRDRVDNNVYDLVGSGAPSTAAGFAGPGSSYTDIATGTMYVNIGTLAVPVWVVDSGASIFQQLSGVISPANIIGTAAGQLGHANGVIMVPAPGLHNVVELISVVLQSKFGVAAYTAGGNITANQGAGGAAITGLVSAANSLGNAASKSINLVPLATVGIPLVENGPINLVSSAAFTNPGTAVGTLTWVVNYRVHATGF